MMHSRKMRFILQTILFLFVMIIIFPFLWMIIGSVQNLDHVRSPRLFIKGLHFSNFVEAWNSAPFGRYLFNSILISVSVLIGQLFTNIMAAYAFARLNFKGKKILFFIVLSTLMVPIQVTFIPNFVIISKLGWYNTYLALIIPFCTSAFGIFLMRQAFLQIPREVEEAAIIDGANHFHIIRHLIIPLTKPTIITCALLSFIAQYSDLFWPLIVTNTEEMRTIQVGLSIFIDNEGGAGPQWHMLMAASLIAILPMLVLLIFAQKYIMKGIQGVKHINKEVLKK